MASGRFSPGGLAATSARHPWLTIGIWLIVAVVVTVTSGLVTPLKYTDDFTNNPESQHGHNLLEAHFGQDTNASETLYFRSDAFTVEDPEFRQVVDGTIANLSGWQGDIAGVVNYYDAPKTPEMAPMVSEDRHALIVPVQFKQEWSEYSDRSDTYIDAIKASRVNGFEVYSVGDLSSDEIGHIAQEDLEKDITIGLPAAGIILLFVFGALVAAMVPLLLGVLTILTATAIANIIAGWLVIEDSGFIIVTMIGLAVGIDYALFYLERYREERRLGATKIDAIERSGATAGKAVLFSGGTVMLALLGLMLMPITVFRGMGLGAAVTVVIAVLAALTLLPAMIRLIGDWINFPRVGLMRALKRQDQSGAVHVKPHNGRGLWGRLADGVMQRPWLAVVLVGGFLVLSALPVFTMKLGQPTVDALPTSDFKRGYELIAQDFSAGIDDPVRVVIDADASDPVIQQQVKTFTELVKGDPKFGSVSISPSEDGQLTVVDVVTVADPFSPEGESAARSIRDSLVPQAFGERASDVYVTGSSAFNIDFNAILGDRLPVVFAFVLGLSFVLLLVAFRSVTVPVMSIALNMLSVGAAYGAVVAVFQHGWFANLLGVTQVEQIVNWLPVMLFCILFGLSMDYHVFLLSRIREHWDHTQDNQASIVVGVQSTGRIITGAALIMVAVFSAFAMGRLAEVQQMGFGLGVAVLLDATLIRTVLVPAIMRIIGDRNWWFPNWLSWMPNLHVEGNLEPIELSRQPGTAD